MRGDVLFMVPLLAITLVGGACRNVNGASDDALLGQQGTCAERAVRAQEDVESVRLANLECGADDDCTLFDPSTLCRGQCPDAVATSGLEEVEGAIGRVDETICRDFAAEGCPLATPGCAAVRATCEAGVCVSEPES